VKCSIKAQIAGHNISKAICTSPLHQILNVTTIRYTPSKTNTRTTINVMFNNTHLHMHMSTPAS